MENSVLVLQPNVQNCSSCNQTCNQPCNRSCPQTLQQHYSTNKQPHKCSQATIPPIIVRTHVLQKLQVAMKTKADVELNISNVRRKIEENTNLISYRFETLNDDLLHFQKELQLINGEINDLLSQLLFTEKFCLLFGGTSKL